MTDLHSLLRQSIIDKGIRDPDDRVAIYLEARNAVERRLTQRDPPLSPDVIDARIADFDDAVLEIEKELHEYFYRVAELPPPDDGYDGYDEPEPDYVDGGPARPLRQSYYDETEPTAPAAGEPDQPAYGETYGDPAAADGASSEEGYNPPALYDDEHAGDVVAYRDDGYIYDEPLGYDPQDDDMALVYDDPDAYAPPVGDDRWSELRGVDEDVGPRDAAPPQRLRPNTGDRVKVGLLVGVIAALVIALGVLASLMLTARTTPEGVTVAIDEGRQVSDAATALRVAAEDLGIEQTFVLFEGLDPTVFESASSNPVRFDSDASGTFARVSTSAGASGSRLRIGPGLATQLAGQQVRVRLMVRSPRERGALAMRFAYQSGVAISHWQTANLEAAYTEVAIRWRIPAQVTSAVGDYLIIEPGIPGDGTGVDLRRVEIDVLS